jgi:hypothetical protein
VPAALPSTRVYVFTGVDASGRTWSQQYTLTLEGPLQTPDITLVSAPATVQQNPVADSSCQWSQQLILQEQLGFEIQLARFLAGGVDWSSQIRQLFGTAHLAPLCCDVFLGAHGDYYGMDRKVARMKEGGLNPLSIRSGTGTTPPKERVRSVRN